MPRGGYSSRPTQNDPYLVLDEDRWAELVIAAKRLGMKPPALHLKMIDDGLLAAAKAIGDLEYEQACRDAHDRMKSAPQRWEFDRDRAAKRSNNLK